MEPRQLEAFAAVMTTGSVTAAARVLQRSQPAVTRLVRELEAELGYDLFDRHGPRVTPNAEAFALLPDAERVLAGLRHLRRRADEIARREPAPLWVAATSALAVGLLPQALARVEAAQGPRPLQLRTAAPEAVLQAVLGGGAQLGASSLPLEHRGVELQWIGQLPCVALLPADDPLAAQPRVALAELATRRLVTLSNPFRLRGRLDAALAAAAPRPGALIETNASINAQALVRAGLGVAVLEPLTPLGAPVDGVVVRPVDTDIPFFFGVVTPSSPTPPAAAVLALSDALLDAAAALPGFVRHDPAEHGRLLEAAHA